MKPNVIPASAPLLIGIAGRKRSGKSTVAREMQYGLTAAGCQAEVRAFADPLREMLLDLDPWVGVNAPVRLSTAIELHGWEGVKRQPRLAAEVRRLMQRLGTDAVRSRSEHFWTNLMHHYVQSSSAAVVIAPDVRFANEARMCDYVIAIERPAEPHADAHPSEVGPREAFPELVDVYVRNDGTLRELATTVRRVLLDMPVPGAKL